MTRLIDMPDVANYLQQGAFTLEGGFRNETPASYCDFHSHPFMEIVMHLDNHGTVYLKSGQDLTFTPGSFVVHPADIPHAQQTEVAGADLCLLIGGPPNPPTALLKLHIVAAGRHPWLATDVQALMEANRRTSQIMSKAYDCRAAALLMHLLDGVDEGDGAQNDSSAALLARNADRTILRDFGTLTGVGDLASRLCVSASYLRHVFKEHVGIGVKQRLIQVRIDRACDLLVGSTLPINSISAVCGFENDRYFATSFKAALGCSAGEYRRRSTI
jgi:AraC-like DNA-binding protein